MVDKRENARIEAFSDGVFAIAMTLLILEIKVPELDSVHSINDLWHQLANLWPSYFAFILSFSVILVSWVNHHYLFDMIDKSSRSFIYANGFLLLTITFMPFPAAVLAKYLGTDYAQPAIAFYCFGGIVNSLSWTLLIHTIYKPILLVEVEANIKLVQKLKQYTSFGVLIYIFTTVMAFWFPIIALVINLMTWILWISTSLTKKIA